MRKSFDLFDLSPTYIRDPLRFNDNSRRQYRFGSFSDICKQNSISFARIHTIDSINKYFVFSLFSPSFLVGESNRDAVFHIFFRNRSVAHTDVRPVTDPSPISIVTHSQQSGHFGVRLGLARM